MEFIQDHKMIDEPARESETPGKDPVQTDGT